LSNGGFLAHRNPKEREDNQPPTPKKLRETVRAFLTPSQAGVVFPAPRVPTLIQKPALPACPIPFTDRQFHGYRTGTHALAPAQRAIQRSRSASTANELDSPLASGPSSLKHLTTDVITTQNHFLNNQPLNM
jgi:hypothetical protein